MATLCVECARDRDLAALIHGHGAAVASCSLCGASDTFAIDAENPCLVAALRALVRKYFDEWDYNTHWGGDGLTKLFCQENPILHFDSAWDTGEIESAVFPALEEGYETPNVPISLFAGYYNGEQNRLLEALAHSEEDRFERLTQRTLKENAYRVEAEARALLTPHLDRLRMRVPAGLTVARARIGFARRNYEMFRARSEAWAYEPYAGTELGAPPAFIAAAGRMNRAGVSFLYAASDPDTAISEVRPHPGHTVSVGEFRARRELVIANFTQISITDFSASDRELLDYWFLLSIDRLFSMPVTPEERSNYILSQLLADVVRQLDFDGVAFRSSVGAGVNYTFFDAEQFEFVSDSARAVQITGLSYGHRVLRALGPTD